MYNKWATDKEYRKQIIHWFDLNFTDERFNNFISTTPGYEYGNNKDSHKEVLQRWKLIKDHPSIKLIQKDGGLVDMCDKIFGINPEGQQ